jgi:hypothetical protein
VIAWRVGIGDGSRITRSGARGLAVAVVAAGKTPKRVTTP